MRHLLYDSEIEKIPIHKEVEFIINLNKITTIERNRIIFDKDIYIPVSDHYKEKFQKYLDENFLV